MIGEFLEKYLPFIKKTSKNINSIPGLRGSEKVEYVLTGYNNAIDFTTSELERSSEMWNLYSGIDYSQYPAAVKAQMEQEGRNPFQGNFIRAKVDGLAGSIIKNFYEAAFEPINAEHSDITRHIKELMLIDKELLDWGQCERDIIIDGLIHQAVAQIYIDYRYSPLGNIGFKRIIPGMILLDPSWISNNTWELKRAWKTAYLTPQEIKDTYKTKAQEIEDYIKIKEGFPEDFDQGDTTKGFPYYEHNASYADRYRVIEYHHMEKETKEVEIVVATGTTVPDGPDEFKREWAILNQIDLSDGIMSRKVDIDTYYITTICPSISRYLVLEDKKDLIQIGRLPFFPWSCARINGKNSGIPDLLKSVQQTFNYRQSMLDYSVSVSANGAHFIDPIIVDNDTAKMQKLADNWNNPSFKMFTAPGVLANGRELIKELPRTNIDYNIVNEINRMVDIADLISKQPAVMDARSEGSEETGILYARKQLQAEITQTILSKSMEQHNNEKYEAYLLLAKTLYSGVYRDFYVIGSNKKIELNKPTVTPAGEVVENDISLLPRMKVIVSQSPEGITQRSIDRAINTELLRVLGPESPLSRVLAVGNVLKTLDHNKEERAKYQQSSELEYQLAQENILTQILQLKAAQMQVQGQLAMAMQPQLPNAEQVPNQNNAPGNPEGNLEGNLANTGMANQIA